MNQIKAHVLVDRSTSRAIWKLALPSMASAALMSLFNLVDMIWVGKLGAEAIAGVSAATFYIWTAYAITDITSYGIKAFVAQRTGGDRLSQANNAMLVGVMLGLILSIIVSIMGVILAPLMFEFMNLPPQVAKPARHYFDFFMAGLSATFTFRNILAAFRGSGDARTPMFILSLCLIFNLLIDPLLIFGYWFIPGLGVKGSSLATVLTHLLGCMIGFYILRQRNWELNFFALFKEFGLKEIIHGMYRISKIGLPVSITSLIYSQVYVQLTPLIAEFGTEAVAAIGIGQRIEEFTQFICIGFSISASTLVGQNMGANRLKEAEQSVWSTIFYQAALMLPVIYVLITMPESCILFFTNDLMVIETGVGYLIILGASLFFLGVEYIMVEAFCGAGRSWPTLVIDAPITVSLIPIAFVLTRHFGYGVQGIWWAIAISSMLKGTLLVILFKLGMHQNRFHILK